MQYLQCSYVCMFTMRKSSPSTKELVSLSIEKGTHFFPGHFETLCTPVIAQLFTFYSPCVFVSHFNRFKVKEISNVFIFTTAFFILR